MTRPVIYATRALTRDGTRITSRFNLTQYLKVLASRSGDCLLLGGTWKWPRG
jgi:hypothetical protein